MLDISVRAAATSGGSSVKCKSLLHLCVSTNGASTLGAGVGTELIEALGAHMLVVLLHILFAVQVVAAVVAVEAVSHGGAHIMPGT